MKALCHWKVAVGAFALAALACSSAAAPGAESTQRQGFGELATGAGSPYTHYRRDSRYVPVRDGVRLAVDIFRPLTAEGASDGPLPVILYYGRYWRAWRDHNGAVHTNLGVLPAGDRVGSLIASDDSGRLLFWDTGRESIPELVRNGYIFVRAEGRGTGASEGIRLADYTAQEARDGADLVEWVARQEWSNGNVGMLGGSYPGMTQLHVAALQPDALKAIFPAAPALDFYRLGTAGVGVLHKGIIGYRMSQAKKDGLEGGDQASRLVPVDDDPDGDYLAQVLRERAEKTPPNVLLRAMNDMAPDFVATGEHLRRGLGLASPGEVIATLLDTQALLQALAGKPELQQVAQRGLTLYRDAPTFSDPQTAGRKSVHLSLPEVSRSGIAVYLWTGWYDMDTTGTMLMYRNLTGPRKLTVGPWSHGPNEANGVSDSPLARHEARARRLLTAEALRWFDYWLKGIDNGVMEEAPLHLGYENDTGEIAWKTAGQWPLPGGEGRALFLNPEHSGSVESVNDGGLSDRSPRREDTVAFEVDYRATMGPQSRYHDAFSGAPAMAYPDLERHARGALTFTSAPLEKDLLVMGHPVVHLSARSTAPDGDLFFYLEDVGERGVRYVTEAVMRASHRRQGEAPYNVADLPFSASSRAAVEDTADFNTAMVPLVADFQPTGYLFRAGHRVRLVVTGADADNYITPPVLPEPTIRVQLGGDNASRLVLPLQPTGAD